MDDGTGVCRFLDRQTNFCTIYASRPLFCNVDATYGVLFREKMTREEFYDLNYRACKKLKEEWNNAQSDSMKSESGLTT